MRAQLHVIVLDAFVTRVMAFDFHRNLLGELEGNSVANDPKEAVDRTNLVKVIKGVGAKNETK